jgi:uncharacterized OB-fold protein
MSANGIARAALYLPPGRAAGVPRAGWDEDAFTLAIAAVERLGGDPGRVGVPGRVLLVGPFPPSSEANLARFFGATIPIERAGVGADGLAGAARSLGELGDGSSAALVLVADVAADPPETLPGDASSGPDGAVAVWIGSGDGSARELASIGSATPGPNAVRPFLEWRRAHESAVPPGGAGPWAVPDAPTSSAAAGANRPRPKLAPGAPVSQGAYVPLSRYEENVPSRWRFAAETCAACGSITFPVRGRCRRCGRRDRLSGTYLPTDGGLVVAATTIGRGGQPTEFDEQVASGGPYEVALIELVPEVRVTLQVTDTTAGSLRIGDRVRTTLRRIYPMEGEWRYGRKAIRAGTRDG